MAKGNGCLVVGIVLYANTLAIKIVDGKIFSHFIEKQRGHWSYFGAALSTVWFCLGASWQCSSLTESGFLALEYRCQRRSGVLLAALTLRLSLGAQWLESCN